MTSKAVYRWQQIGGARFITFRMNKPHSIRAETNGVFVFVLSSHKLFIDLCRANCSHFSCLSEFVPPVQAGAHCSDGRLITWFDRFSHNRGYHAHQTNTGHQAVEAPNDTEAVDKSVGVQSGAE
ncbi:hypothetical protein NT6N_13680 [Oceaniferula spumae]|uniref:Uncharacterized protein n=1 Tax=Oceaniferula spumae TaxID=2979115 RepID=A0AAT9FK26_9BACT